MGVVIQEGCAFVSYMYATTTTEVAAAIELGTLLYRVNHATQVLQSLSKIPAQVSKLVDSFEVVLGAEDWFCRADATKW